MARTRCSCGGPIVVGEGYEVCSSCGDTRKAGEMTGSERIAEERRRQIESEGWTPEHDQHHVELELARAAVVYAMPPTWRTETDIANVLYGRTARNGTRFFGVWPEEWPYKPSYEDRIRELEKAGALIAAEIDRLQASESVAAEIVAEPFEEAP